MSILCDFAIDPNATSDELKTVGNALWRWWSTNSADGDQRVCNQAVADLLLGRLPMSNRSPGQAGRWSVHFRVRNEAFKDRKTMLDSMRRDIPRRGITDILVDGQSNQELLDGQPGIHG